MTVTSNTTLNILPGLEQAMASRSYEQAWYGSLAQPDDDLDESPFVLNLLASIRGFVRCVDTADFRVRSHFQEALWFLAQLGVSEAELGEIFAVTTNAVNRWINGRAAPSPVMRRLVVIAGLELLKRDGVKMAGRRVDVVTGRPFVSSASAIAN